MHYDIFGNEMQVKIVITVFKISGYHTDEMLYIISTKFLFILNSARALRTTTQYNHLLGNVRTT